MTNTSAASPFSPIVKVVTVRATPEQAFRRFTQEIGVWWPLKSHSVGEDQAETVVMEGRVGGRIVERIRDGREVVWGTITAWEPPRRVAFTWHPGQAPATAQDVDVRFAPAGERTRVELEHRGFERLGAQARRARRGYPIGWAYVLGLYANQRGPFMWLVGGLTTILMGLQRLRAKRVESTEAPSRRSA
ncbi:MAG TPA: SRPBCC family protein [Vicinamibacterales bacterium]